jgi:hypothetical protein
VRPPFSMSVPSSAAAFSAICFVRGYVCVRVCVSVSVCLCLCVHTQNERVGGRWAKFQSCNRRIISNYANLPNNMPPPTQSSSCHHHLLPPVNRRRRKRCRLWSWAARFCSGPPSPVLACVCVCGRERERVSECVWGGGRERVSERVCVCGG